MPEPLTITVLTGLSGALSASITGIKFFFDLKNTSIDVKTCLELVERINNDLQYLISLRTGYAKNLESTPQVLARVDGVIQDAYKSIQSVGALLEGCRKEAHGGQTPFKGRMKWVLADSTAFQRRTGNLLVQQAAINVEITNLRSIETMQPLRSLASEISFENLGGMIPMGREKSSSNASQSYRPDLESPPSYSSINPLLSYSPSSSSSSTFSPYTPEQPVATNSYFDYDRQQSEYRLQNTSNVMRPNMLQLPRAQVQDSYVKAVENIELEEEEDESAAAFYRELRLQSEGQRRLRNF